MRIFRTLWCVPGGGKDKIVSAVKRIPIRQDAIKTRKENTILHKLFGKYLLITNTISAGVLMVTGDIICQEIEFRAKIIDKRYDWKRTGQMFLVGCLAGPPHHVFYKWVDRIIPRADLKAVGQKILLDQLIFSPFCIFTFFYAAGFLENKKFRECNEEIRQKFLTVYITDWTVWPAAQFINFYFLSPQYRVLYVNALTTMYNVFLSHIKHKDMTIKES